MPIIWDKQRKRWRYTFNRVVTIDGVKRRKRATKRLPKGWDREQAEEYERQQTPELYALATGVRKPKYMIAKAVQLYVEDKVPHLRNGKKAAQELANMLPYYATRPIEDLAHVAAEYTKDCAGLAPATVRNRLAYLRAACRYAQRQYQWPTAKPELSTPKVRNSREVYLRIEDQERLWEYIEDVEARALFTLAYYIGARWRSELLPRQPEDVKRDGKDVWIDCGITKNGRRKWKWVPGPARWAVKYIPFQYQDTYYYRHWRAAVASAGLGDIKPHDQRHSLASVILNGGGTLPDVTAALGQESLAAASRYSHLYPERVKAVMKRHTRKG